MIVTNSITLRNLIMNFPIFTLPQSTLMAKFGPQLNITSRHKNSQKLNLIMPRLFVRHLNPALPSDLLVLENSLLETTGMRLRSTLCLNVSGLNSPRINIVEKLFWKLGKVNLLKTLRKIISGETGAQVARVSICLASYLWRLERKLGLSRIKRWRKGENSLKWSKYSKSSDILLVNCVYILSI